MTSSNPGALICKMGMLKAVPALQGGCELPFPLPGDLPNPKIEPAWPASPALAGLFSFFLTTEPPGKPHSCCRISRKSDLKEH